MARVLIVDDEQDVREMLRDALVLRKHEVDLAGDATAALQAEKSAHHDIAIIDFVLPGKRGLDLLRGLRRINPFLRSIIISGEVDHDVLDPKELEKQLKDKVETDRYLPKPISVDRLAEVVDELSSGLGQRETDWKKIAQDVVAAREVKAKDIREMDKILQRSRRKRKK